MKPLSQLQFSSRGWLTVMLTVGGLFGSGSTACAAPTGVGETPHFWYRLAPKDGPYIDTQRGSQAFGLGDGKIFLSNDNARTWPHQADFPDAKDINFSCILGNGNIVFATATKLYLGTNKLKTVREIVVKDREGRDYVPPPPKDPEKAGLFYYSLDGVNTFDVGGKEMLIWGNYCNVGTDLVAANVYYSADGGETVKIAYAFGRNPSYVARVTDPSYLGAADNPVFCRHIHSVAYNPAENAFYACTGDNDRGHGLECHWLRGTYDARADRWNWKVVMSSISNSRYKSGGINFVDGQIYWTADSNGSKKPDEKYDRGIFRSAPADFIHPDRHTKIFDAQYEIAVMTIEGDVILAPAYGPADPCDTGFIISTDRGKTWGQYDLKEFGDRSGTRVNKRNSDGWFRVDLRVKWTNRGEVLFIKPKPGK